MGEGAWGGVVMGRHGLKGVESWHLNPMPPVGPKAWLVTLRMAAATWASPYDPCYTT